MHSWREKRKNYIYNAPEVWSHMTTKVFGGQNPALFPTIGTYVDVRSLIRFER